MEFLTQYYQNYDEQGRLGTRYGHVEFLTTMTYIGKHLQPGMRVMEIGAGTGRYSHALAQRGYRVDAVELLEHNISQFQALTQPGENVTVTQGDARNLSAFADDTYDVTLLLGPLYHLYTEADKLQALREAVRVTRRGGTVFAAYCMADPTIVQHAFIKGNIHSLIERGMIDTDTFTARSEPCDLFELHRVEDILRLRSKLPVESIALVAADGYANHMREALAVMPEDVYALYLQYHLATCERMELMGYSHHTLDIFRKRRD